MKYTEYSAKCDMLAVELRVVLADTQKHIIEKTKVRRQLDERFHPMIRFAPNDIELEKEFSEMNAALEKICGHLERGKNEAGEAQEEDVDFVLVAIIERVERVIESMKFELKHDHVATDSEPMVSLEFELGADFSAYEFRARQWSLWNGGLGRNSVHEEIRRSSAFSNHAGVSGPVVSTNIIKP